jgi:hypothetical protein
LSTQGGVGSIDNAATLSAGVSGRPIPALNNPRMIFNKLFKAAEGDKAAQRKANRYESKLVDMVLENAKDMSRRISKNDQAKMDQYLTSMSEIEETINNNFEWIDKPGKEMDTGHIKENVDANIDPDQYFKTMFDLMTLTFEADLTRSITFAMSMSGPNGIADKFPTLVLKGGKAHHMWTHAGGPYDKEMHLGKYDQYLSQKAADFLTKLDKSKQGTGSILDNTAVLYGSANSSNHNWKNLPLILAGGSNLGFKHGKHVKYSNKAMNDLHLSILHSVGIKQKRYGDSSGIIHDLFS